MERFKQTIAKLENDIAELRQFQTKIQGSKPSKGDVHYCTSTQEFGEYSLDEIDTFRFQVRVEGVNKIPMYHYSLLNPTPELTAYLNTQKMTFNIGKYIPVDPENFETYCIKKGGTPFVLTEEIRKCLDSKLWEYVVDTADYNRTIYNQDRQDIVDLHKDIPKNLCLDIPITFNNTYTISPHVSFYITPLLPHCGVGGNIIEITTKQVVFRVNYDGASTKNVTGLKLHYSVNGIVKQPDDLLD